MKGIKLHDVISFAILPVTILSVIPFPGPYTNLITIFSNAILWWIIIIYILYSYWKSKKVYTNKQSVKHMFFIQWYFLWNIYCFFRGCFIAENYWDWKGLLFNAFALMIPIVAYTATNNYIMQSILSFYIKYTLPLFIIFAILISPGAYGFFLVPVSFLLLFLPIMTLRWKLTMLLFAIIVILADLSARSNVIKFGLPIILSLIYYFRNIVPNILYELIRNVFIIAPFIFLGLGVTGVFNVFQMDEYTGGDYVELKETANGEMSEVSLTDDTRTFLYVEVLQTAKKYNSWLIGRSPARGNESEAFGESDPSGRGERLSNEAAILNIFTWTGIVGVFLFFLVFYRASYLAVNQSNNIFAKLLGLFVAFRWTYAWVEDGNFFNLSTFILWFMIGLCYSNAFRNMTNKEVKYWVWGIFDKRYAIRSNI